MKLHLPKQLFTALLAAITLAAPATLTLGSTAWGVEDADSTVWSGNDSNTWYVTSDTENALESIDATTIDKTSVFIRATKDDVVRTVGTLTLKNADTLTIAGDWDSATAHFDALTIESLVIGSGEQPGSANLTVGAAQNGGTPAQAVTINSLTGSVGNLNLGAKSTLTLNGPVTLASASTLNLAEGSDLVLNNAGTIVLHNESNSTEYKKVTGSGTLTIGNGTVIDLANTSRPGATGAIEGSVVVLGGGKLLLSGNSTSLLGYDNGATDNVYLSGSAGNVATMEITTTHNQHLSTNLYLQGYAQVTGESGIIETYNGRITATGTNNTIYSTINVNRDITVEVTGADDTLELRGYVYGGTMTKEGSGTLTFSNAGANKNSLSNYTHNSGITKLNTEFSFTSSLTVNAGEVQAKGKTTISGALNLQGGDLSIYGNTTISGNITQTEGTLTIQQGGNLVLDAASFADDISLLGSGTLTLAGAYKKPRNLSFTTGVTELVNFSQVGAGALNLGTVNLTGAFLMMNYEGGAIHVTSLGTVAEGMELVYGKGSQLVNLGTFNQSLTLNFFDVADQLGTGVNLGLSLGGKTLEEAKALLSVNGLQGDYTLEERGGSLYLTSTGTLTSTGWDINWGGRGLVSAPALSAEHICTNVTSDRTVVNGSYYMIDESFENGEKVVVDLQDTTNSGKSIVGGFATQTNSNTQGSVNREVWIKATAGNYAFIVGGNLANNWDGGSAADFLGDTHILVDGTNVTVGSVIGANHLDSKSPTFRGNTYISVMNGTITGDIIGSGSATHNEGTNKQVGDTHVFVYNNQTNGGYVTGGGIAGGFDNQNRNQQLTLEGDTHVTVDLSEQSGALTFAKNIVGAHVYKKTATPTLVHAGTTNITLIGNSDSDTRFNGLVIGGNYSAAGGTLTAGDVNMSIGASVHNIIVGGNYASNGSTMSVGDVNMSIGSYVGNDIIGGNYTVTANATTTAQNIAIAVGQDGHVNGNLVGGHYVDGKGDATLSGGLGDVTITLAGGTIGNTYGGSWLKRNLSTANINQGNIHINLEGGNLNGNVYAAGYQEGSSMMTTASTKVSVDSDVAIASGVTISGGYLYAESKTGSTVTGSKTLVFNGESQDRSGIIFDSFDTIEVTNKDTVVTLGTLSNFTALTKTGAGTLTLSGTNTYTGTTSVQGGELILTSASALGSGNISVAEGAALTLNINSTIELSAAERISGAGTVHIMNGTTLVMSHSSGTAAVKGSRIHVHGGGILNLDGNDRLGWESNATGAILLKGESDTKVATLQLGGRQTMTTSLLMQGNALVESTGGTGGDAGGLNPLKASGAQITATGKNNIINATLHRRDAFLFEVTGADDELEVKGNVVTQAGGTSGGYDDSPYEAGSIVKDGAGKLTFSGSDNTFDKKYLHKAGTSVMSGTADFTSTVEIQSGKFETSGTTTMSGAITNNGTFEVSGGTATISGAVTNNSAITVSGGEADFTGTLTMGTGSSLTVSNGSATVSGALNVTGTLTMGTGSSLTVSDGSATVSGALNVTGTGVQIGQSGNGELNLTGSVSVAEGAAATLSGAITLGHTLTNNGSLTLNGTIYLAGDIDSSYEHREQGGTSYALAGGTDSTNEQNGFMTVEGASYYLAQSSNGVTDATNTLGSNFATNTAGDTVVYHGNTSYKVDTDSKGLYFSTGDITGTRYYITTGEVVVDNAVQAAATGYSLQGGTMIITDGSVSASAITCDGSKYTTTSGTTGIITVGAGAELVLDGVPAGMTVNSLLSSILSSTSAGNVKIALSGLDTYDGEGSGKADYSLNSAFAGTLELAAGVDFTLGNGNKDSYSQDAVITLGNLSGMKLNDGSTLYYNASGVTTIKNLQVVDAASATIHFKDSNSANAVQFAEKTQLDGDLTVSTKYDGGITFTNLVGDGSLTGSSGDGPFNTTISSLQYTEGDETSTFTGSLSFSGGNNVVAVSTGTEAAISFVSLSATNVNSLTFKVQTDTSIEALDVATGAVIVSDGKTLTLGGGTAEAQAQHSIGTLSGSSSATLSLSANSSLALGAGEVGMNLTGSGELTKTGDGTLALTNANGSFTGNIIVSGGVLKAGANQSDEYFGDDYKGNKTRTITVQDGATLDVNGTEAYYHVVLEQGATITNSGTNTNNNGNVGSGWKALPWVELEGDAEFNAQKQMVMQKGDGDSGTFKLDLNGHTLTKTGSNKLYMKNVGITSGCIQIDAGEVQLDSGVTLESGVQIGMAADTTLTLSENASLELLSAASGTVNVSAEKTLTLGSGTAEAQKQHSIGTLSAASAGVTLGEYATLTLGGGTAEAQKQHSIGTLSSHSTSKVSISSGSNLILTSVASANGDITGDGALTLQTGSTVGLGHGIFGSAINTINLTGAGSGLEITSSSNQPTNFGKIQNINVKDGATFYNRVTSSNGWVLDPENNINISLAGAGNGAATGGAALSLGYDCSNGGTVAFGDKVNFSLSDDATVIVHGRNKGNSADIAGVINTTIQGNGHTLTKIGTGKLTLENGASNTSLNVNEGELVLKGAATTSERVELNGGTLKLADQATVTTRQGSADAATMSKVQMSSTGITGTAQDGSSSIANALVEMQSATSFSISDMVLSNVKLSAVEGASVALNNVSGSAELAGAGSYNIGTGAAQYTLGMTPAQVGTIENDNGGTALTLSYSSNTAITMSSTGSQLLLSADPTADVNGVFGTYNLTLTLNYTLAGDLASADTVNWQELVGFTGVLGDLLTAQTPEATVDLAEGEAAVAAAGTTPTVEYNYTAPGEGAQVGTLVITINGLNVPEPATSTLSLLALAALAARRRRK